MKHSLPEKRDPFVMLETALTAGWQPVDSIPLKGQGTFFVLTLSGLVRSARSTKVERKARVADKYGPARTNVVGVESGNYLAAIAWRWAEG